MSYDFSNSGIYTKTYAMSLRSVQALADYMIDPTFWNSLESIFKGINSSTLDAILSVRLMPFDVGSFLSLGQYEEIKIGNVTAPYSPASPIYGKYIPYDAGTSHYLGAWTLPALDGISPSFLDGSRSTSVIVYLPFVGWKELNPDDVIGKTIGITYNIDNTTGDGCVYLTDASTSIVLYTFPVVCGVDIPIVRSDATEKMLAKITQGINGAESVIRGGGMLAAGNADGVRSIASGVGSIALNNFQNATAYRTSGSIGGTADINFSLIPSFVIYRPNAVLPTSTDMDTYRKTHGLPSMRTAEIGEMVGFTRIDGIRYDDIPLTEQELGELDSILRTGAIWPGESDPPIPPSPPDPPTPPEPPTPSLDLLGKYGIDISEAQAGLTWADYSQASPEISFGFIRSGVFYGDGSFEQDAEVQNNISALDGHIPVGFYFVPHGQSSLPLRTQGAIFANWVKNTYITPKGKNPDLPCWIDVESRYGIFNMEPLQAEEAIQQICAGFWSVLPDIQLGVYSTYLFSQKLPVSTWDRILFWEALWGYNETYADSVIEPYGSIIQYGPDTNDPPLVYPRYVINGRNVDKDRVLRAWWS